MALLYAHHAKAVRWRDGVVDMLVLTPFTMGSLYLISRRRPAGLALALTRDAPTW